MTSRDRDARLAATIARGSGLTQRPAVLVVRQLDPVTALLARDDRTVRTVLEDPRTRRSLVEEVRGAFPDGWRRATLAKVRSDHGDWLRQWWLPACTDAELARLRTAPALRPEHHRVGLSLAAFPATVGAAEVLLDDNHRRMVGDTHLVVERRVAEAARREAAEHDLTALESPSPGGADRAPEGVDPRDHPHTAWWHG